MTVGEHIREWLDEIGADGLMYPEDDFIWEKNNIKGKVDTTLVPAFRHADGSYYAEKEQPCNHCKGCDSLPIGECPDDATWFAHKEATK